MTFCLITEAKCHNFFEKVVTFGANIKTAHFHNLFAIFKFSREKGSSIENLNNLQRRLPIHFAVRLLSHDIRIWRGLRQISFETAKSQVEAQCFSVPEVYSAAEMREPENIRNCWSIVPCKVSTGKKHPFCKSNRPKTLVGNEMPVK